MKPQKVILITIHHTATKQQPKITIERKMRGLQDFSQRATTLAGGKKKPVWADVPYHYYINVDGQIAEGRSIEYAGDTNTEYNPSGHALIVLEGNFETEKPATEQLKSLNILTIWLMKKYSISSEKVKSHKDYASTACPGKNMYKLLPSIRKELSDEAGEKVTNGRKKNVK
jgi:N-acetyl-anhydromuramyl-L-alanine amidase AmpD